MMSYKRPKASVGVMILCAGLVTFGYRTGEALAKGKSVRAVVTVAEGRALSQHLRIAWRAEVPRVPFGGVRDMYIDRDLLLVETTYNLLVALDEKTGKPKWVLKTRAPLDFAPCSFGDRLYFFAADAMYVVDRPKGEILERKNPHLGVLSVPGADRRHVFVATVDGRVCGVRPSDIWPAWTRSIESVPVGAVFRPPNRLHVVTHDSDLISVDPLMGDIRWKVSLGPKAPLAGPASSNKAVYVAGRDLFVRAFDNSGAEVWKAPVGGEALLAPAFVRGKVVVTVTPNAAAVVDAQNGKLLWRQPGPARFLTASEKRAYFLDHATRPTKLLCYDLADGKPQGALDARAFHSFRADPEGGRFIASTKDGKVYGIIDGLAPDE